MPTRSGWPYLLCLALAACGGALPPPGPARAEQGPSRDSVTLILEEPSYLLVLEFQPGASLQLLAQSMAATTRLTLPRPLEAAAPPHLPHESDTPRMMVMVGHSAPETNLGTTATPWSESRLRWEGSAVASTVQRSPDSPLWLVVLLPGPLEPAVAESLVALTPARHALTLARAAVAARLGVPGDRVGVLSPN